MGIDENNDEMAETDSGVKNGNGTWSDTVNVNTEPPSLMCVLPFLFWLQLENPITLPLMPLPIHPSIYPCTIY